MRIIFLGTPTFAVPTLEHLRQSGHQIVAVLTQPDRPRERGLKLIASPVKETASTLGIPILQPDKASAPAVVDQLRRLEPDAAVVVAYGQMLRRNFLSLPRHGCINLHASLLPKYRGPSPIQAAVLAGDRATGVTTILLDEGMDTGPILLQQKIPISDDDTAGTLHDTLARIGAVLTVKTLDALEKGEISPQPQDSERATATRKITKSDAKIDWRRSSREIANQVRAFDPWPGCETLLEGRVLKIWKAAPAEVAGSGEPGRIISAAASDLIVAVADGALKILELQLAGGRRMSSSEFLRGHPLEAGAVLGK